VSWRILLGDLEALLTTGTVSTPVGTSFRQWTVALAAHAEKNWSPKQALPFEVPPANFAYWDMDDGANAFGNASSAEFVLDSDVTRLLLGPSNDAFGTEVTDILVASLLYSFSHEFSDREAPCVFLENHGRLPWEAQQDLSATVGWFTTCYPCALPISQRAAPVLDMVRLVKDQRRSIPNNGLSYFASRYHSAAGRKLFGSHDRMEILFNYHGRYQQFEDSTALLHQPEHLAALDLGAISGHVRRLALIEVNAVVSHDRLKVSIMWSRNMCH
jgi:non-ribosomal peptide synthase protein (TIGR01720 family)